MIRYVLRRLLQLVPVFFGTTFLIYVLVWALPGDPFSGKCGQAACPAAYVAQMTEKYHLNDNIFVQYFKYLGSLFTGDWGETFNGTSVGELQARGSWIASAYYKDGASPEKFMDGWLRTGDVATIDREGSIRITDRTKDLIKSGGEWISSVALESMIMGHPDVAEAAVIAVPHERWSERPLACVVARPEARDRLTREGVLEHLRSRVAKWWLPDDVVFIDQVPKTSVGKFDKKALRERFRGHGRP